MYVPSFVSAPSFPKVVKGKCIQERNDEPVMVLECGSLNYGGDYVLAGCAKDFKTLPNISNWTTPFEVSDKVVWINVEGVPLQPWSHYTFTKIENKWGELVYTYESNISNKYNMRLCVKTEVKHLIAKSFKVILEGKICVVRGKEVIGWVLDFVEEEMSILIMVVNNWEEVIDDGENNPNVHVDATSDDPFGLEKLLSESNKKGVNVAYAKSSSDLKFPPGFTPLNSVNFLSLQETKMGSFDVFMVKAFWVNMLFDFATSLAHGRSGTWLVTGLDFLFMSVYSPQELSRKREHWTYMTGIIYHSNGEVIAMGDCNEMRFASERNGSTFHASNADKCSMFIANSHWIDIPLGGYSFTWSDKYASKMSKLERFLVSEGLLDLFPNLSGLIFDCHISDHKPIPLMEFHMDYGPTPFRFFH
ncbi:RNA-directed DNA polymerase, eukaryota [Tanacetum coccineum]